MARNEYDAESRPGSYERRPDAGRDGSRDALVQRIALVVGATFLLVGILGFIPGITQDFDQIEFAGHESGAELLGLFKVSVLHNIVHLLFGVLGVALARRADTARVFLIGGGIVYLVLFAYGLAIDHDSDANFVPVNDADNWLHLGLGMGMILLGLITLPRRRAVDKPGMRTRPTRSRSDSP